MATKIKKTSKFVGQKYESNDLQEPTKIHTWTVTDIFVARVQGKKCTKKRVKNERGNLVLAKAKRPGHQSYTYILERITSDAKCDKRIAVNANQMRGIARGTIDIETLADKVFGKAKTDYRFN